MTPPSQAVGSLQVTPLKHPQGCRAYLVVDPASKEALVVDPHLDQAAEVAALVKGAGLRLRWIVDTHTHADHPSGSAPLSGPTGATRVAMAKSKHVGVTLLADDQQPLALGDQSVIVRNAPGHTPDHIVLLSDGAAFSGDSLFIHSVARADFIGGDPGQLYDSIQSVLLALPDDTLLYPGHDYQDRVHSTIGTERAENPWLQIAGRDKFVEAISANKPAEPANMEALLRLNIEGLAIPPGISGAATVKVVEEGGAGSIIDVRELEEIEGAHIKGSRHIVLNEILRRSDEVRATPAPRLILCHIGQRAAMAAHELSKLGIGGMSVISGGIVDYVEAGGEVVGGNLEAASGGGGCCAAEPPPMA